MSGALIGGVIGAVIGMFFGAPEVGWMVGAAIGGLLFPSQSSWPSLKDLAPQSSQYGRPIPIVYSIMALGGNVIWATDLVKTSDGSGGKGSSSPTGPTYAANFAVLICEANGNMALGRVFAGPERRVIYDPAGATLESGAIRFYNGSETQLPDPLIESHLGVGNVPAYRGYCYLVLEGFDVSAHDSNRIPFLTVEVGQKGDVAAPTLGTVWFDWMIDGGTSWIIRYHGSYYGLLQYRKSDFAFLHNRLISYTPSDQFIYDATRDRVIQVTPGMGGGYTVVQMAVGATLSHATGAPSTEISRSIIMQGDQYVIAYSLAAGGTRLYYVNPDTFAVTGTQLIDAGGARVLYLYYAPGASWCWAVLDDNSVVEFALDGHTATSTHIGTLPAGCPGNQCVAVDPNTATLWAAGLVSGTVNWARYSNAAPMGAGSVASSFYGFSNTPWVFSPATSIRPNRAFLCGSRWLATDHFAEFDATGAGSFGGEYDGVYAGTADLEAVAYNNVTGLVNGLRYGYGPDGGQAAISADDTPISLPLFTSGLGVADASLNYQTLGEIVTDLSLRAGLTTAQIDVSALTDQVDGYAIANQVAVKDAIAALMPAYYFDAVEDQGIVKFVKRGGPITVAIPDDDLGAHASGQDVSDLYETTRTMDAELPCTLSVNYALAATKYSASTKYARRLIGYSGVESQLNLPLVLTDQKATEIATVALHAAWVGRLQYQFALGRQYSYLQPTDLVGIAGYTMRMTRMTLKDGVYQCEAVCDDSDTYTPHVIVTETPPVPGAVDVASLTLLELM